MGDRSWNNNYSAGNNRGNGRPRYANSSQHVYFNARMPYVRDREREPHSNYHNNPIRFSNRDFDPPIIRTVINSCYQPQPPAQRPTRYDSRPSSGSGARHHDNSGPPLSKPYESRLSSGSNLRRDDRSPNNSRFQDERSPSNSRFHENRSPNTSRFQGDRSPTNSRFHDDRSSPRSQDRGSPSRSKRSRSPSFYMNRSPPTPRYTSRSSPSPPRHRDNIPPQQTVYYQPKRKSEDQSGPPCRTRSDSTEEQYTRRSHSKG